MLKYYRKLCRKSAPSGYIVCCVDTIDNKPSSLIGCNYLTPLKKRISAHFRAVSGAKSALEIYCASSSICSIAWEVRLTSYRILKGSPGF